MIINEKNDEFEEVFFSCGQICRTGEHDRLQMNLLSSLCGRSSVKHLRIYQNIDFRDHGIGIILCRALGRGLWNDLIFMVKLSE